MESAAGQKQCDDIKLLFHLSVTHSPLHLAARSGLKQAVQELLSRGANVQTVDENGRRKPPRCHPDDSLLLE